MKPLSQGPEWPITHLIHKSLQCLASLNPVTASSGTKLCTLAWEAAEITASFPLVILLEFSE